MKININNLQLTAEAAKYMASLRLVMRNSFTEQAESLHYRRRNFPRTHTPGGGLYCTPLIFELLDFIVRLVALVPKPRFHQIRFQGVFSPIFWTLGLHGCNGLIS